MNLPHPLDRQLRLLDLFCGAGGSSMGFYLAGFEVAGIDINLQPRYPFRFFQEDALEFIAKYGKDFDLICASPPCQQYTKASKQWRKNGRKYPDLIVKTRQALRKVGKPYIIENVPNSPLINPIYLNGSKFGLLVHRPRYFECSFSINQPDIPLTKQLIKMGRPIKDGDIIQPVGHFSGVAYAQKEMDIDWMGQKELSQAIPPSYTKWLGEQFIELTPSA